MKAPAGHRRRVDRVVSAVLHLRLRPGTTACSRVSVRNAAIDSRYPRVAIPRGPEGTDPSSVEGVRRGIPGAVDLPEVRDQAVPRDLNEEGDATTLRTKTMLRGDVGRAANNRPVRYFATPQYR